MALFASLRAAAQRLIQKNGRTVTYRQAGTTLIDPANPQLGASSGTSLFPKAAFILNAFSVSSQALVQTGNKICLIAADDLPGIVPKVNDIIIDKGANWIVVDADSIED